MDAIIPKIIHFFWVGNKHPEWIDYSIKAFKQMNQDFEIKFWSIDDVFEAAHPYSRHCLKLIYTHETTEPEIDCMLLKFMDKPWHFKGFRDKHTVDDMRLYNPIKFKVHFSDVLRFYTLYKEGGIYLDLDTYPIAPFDQKLLELGNFACCTDYSNRNIFSRSNDFFFFGQTKNFVFELDKSNELKTQNIVVKNNWNFYFKKEFMEARDRFFSCQLKENEHFNDPSFYIDHYCGRTWKVEEKNKRGCD